MNTRFLNTLLALTLTVAPFAALPGAAFAATHGAHGGMAMDHNAPAKDAAGHNAHGNAQQPMAEKEVSSPIYTTTGVVDAIDKAATKATISHEPIPALNWPAMTMGFVFEDAALLDELKAGDKVRFDFYNQGNTSVVVDVEPLK